MKRPITCRLPEPLITELDRQVALRDEAAKRAGLPGWDRTKFVERALSRVVEAERERLEKEAAV